MYRGESGGRSRLLAGASATAIMLMGWMALAAPAAAQSAGAATQASDQSQSKTDKESRKAAPEKVGEVVVTGSRIKRPTYDSPTPTVTVNSDTIQHSGATEIAQLLNELPQLTNGYAANTENYSFGDAGLNQVSLRNLGPYRTLTLVDGLRRVGTVDDQNYLAFDLSTIPVALIDHVDVITGGTSAVYGSDAVAGVVNVILKKDFDGLELDATGGETGKGDWSSTAYTATAGLKFDRGDAVFSISHSDSGRLLKRDRGLDVSWRFLPNPAYQAGVNNGQPQQIPYKGVKDFTFGIPTLSGYIPDGPGGAYRAEIWDSTLNDFRPFNAGPQGVIEGAYSLGPDGGRGGYYDTLFEPLNKTNLYSKLKYDIDANTTLNLEGIYANTRSGDTVSPVFDVSSSFISTDNAFMPAALRNRLLAGGQNGFYVNREHDEFGPRTSDITRQYYSVLGDIDGKIRQFDWHIAYQHGESDVQLTNYNDRYDAHWAQAVDSIIDPVTHQAECRDPVARANGCQPVNLFGAGTISQAALGYVRINQAVTTEKTTEDLAQGYFTGDLVDLWAGPLSIAAGAEWRRDAINFDPSYVWQQALGFFATQFEPVNKFDQVTEGYVEAILPVLKDLPFAQKVQLDAAYRYSSYRLAGGVDSWNFGGEWTPVPDIRFRITAAQAVRAPAITELFEPGERGAESITDPCDPLQLDAGTKYRRANCLALGLNPVTFDPNTRRVTTLVLTNGNQGLHPETADTITAGVVLKPRWVPNLQIAVDYYNIDLKGGISQLGAQTTVNNCVDLPALSNQFCQYVQRANDGNIQQIRDTYINSSGYRVEGVDFNLDYHFRLGDVTERLTRKEQDLGRVGFSLTGSYLEHNIYSYKNLATGAVTNYDYAGEYDLPVWRAVANTTWSKGPITANWQVRWASESVINPTATHEEAVYGRWATVPELWVHDVAVTYNTPWNAKFTFGVRDLLDSGVRQHPYTIGGGSTIDDVLGRYVYLSASVKLGRS